MGTTAKRLVQIFIKSLYHWPLYCIVGLWLIFARPYFFNGFIPFPSTYLATFFAPWNATYGMPVKNNAMPDVITQIYPWKKLTLESWKLGQVPRWNPYQFSGTPLAANVQSAVFSPINLLFFLLPFNDAWSMMILLQPLLAGIFMYIFLKGHRLQHLSVLLGSVSFMFCGYITVWMAYGTIGYAILYLPLLLYCLDQTLIKDTRRSRLGIVIAVLLSFFSGHFQTSFYVLGVGLLYGLFQAIVQKQMKKYTIVVFCLGLGVFFALPQLIPSFRFYSQTVRSGLFEKVEVVPWNYILTLFAPDFFGNPVTRNDWFGHYAEWVSFAGVVPLMLALYGIFVTKSKSIYIYFFAALAFSVNFLAFQSPIIDTLIALHIPVISTSALSRIFVLESFSIAVLASFGLNAFMDSWNDQRIRRKTFFYCTVWILFVVFLWALIFFGNLFFIKDVTDEKLQIAQRNLLFPTLMVLFTCAIFVAGYIRKLRFLKIASTFLVIVAAFDLLRFSSKWMPFESRQYMYPEAPVLSYLSVKAGFWRVFGNFGNEAQSPFHIFGIEGYDPLYIKRYGEFMTAAADGTLHDVKRSVVLMDKQGRYTKRFLDLLSVRYILHAKGDGQNVWAFPFWKYPESIGSPIYSDDKFEVYENTTALPRAYLVRSFSVAHSDKEIIQSIVDSATDLSKTVILEENPSSLATDDELGVNDLKRASILRYTPNMIQIEVETSKKSILVLSDTYYPGWSAFIDGKQTKIYRANYIFRAVVVPPGKSDVRFVYDNWFL